MHRKCSTNVKCEVSQWESSFHLTTSSGFFSPRANTKKSKLQTGLCDKKFSLNQTVKKNKDLKEIGWVHDSEFSPWLKCPMRVRGAAPGLEGALSVGLLFKSFQYPWPRESPDPSVKRSNVGCKNLRYRIGQPADLLIISHPWSQTFWSHSRVKGTIWTSKPRRHQMTAATWYISSLIFCFLFRLMEKCKCGLGYQDVSTTRGGKGRFLCNLAGLEWLLLTSWVFLMKY